MTFLKDQITEKDDVILEKSNRLSNSNSENKNLHEALSRMRGDYQTCLTDKDQAMKFYTFWKIIKIEFSSKFLRSILCKLLKLTMLAEIRISNFANVKQN